MSRPKPSNVTPITVHPGVIQSTGEIVDVDFPAVRGRRRTGRRKVFALVDLEALDRLQLGAAEWRVLHHVMRTVHPDTNDCAISGATIARDLQMHPSNVSRALQGLRSRGIILPVRHGHHRINSHIMYRGSNQDWDTATDGEREPIWRRV
jgi:DNA-binding MarR family transcriptional regulator